MRRVALLGFPVAHSVSPTMHNAAFAALRLPWRYEPISATPEDLPNRVDALRDAEWAGANVTVPHKVAAARLVDRLADHASRLGAINTIVNSEGTLVGYNTDIGGFTADLAAHGMDVAGQAAVILGAGGAARAAAWALSEMGADLRIVCRDLSAGREIADILPSGARSPARIFPWTEAGLYSAAEDVALVVNATSLGMFPAFDGTPWPKSIPLPRDAFVYDMIFNPLRTTFVEAALAAGLRACGGLGMLVEQGALALSLWTRSMPPRGVMHSAAMAALEKQHAQISYSR